eukprot:GHVQ01003308.1.p1 GENE.GHVQ01003308.1~~GHVQ01003308.1.p1  ORF type:complete len:674 (+),score=86.61 GHVQ01003308.1:440-2461(+)
MYRVLPRPLLLASYVIFCCCQDVIEWRVTSATLPEQPTDSSEPLRSCSASVYPLRDTPSSTTHNDKQDNKHDEALRNTLRTDPTPPSDDTNNLHTDQLIDHDAVHDVKQAQPRRLSLDNNGTGKGTGDGHDKTAGSGTDKTTVSSTTSTDNALGDAASGGPHSSTDDTLSGSACGGRVEVDAREMPGVATMPSTSTSNASGTATIIYPTGPTGADNDFPADSDPLLEAVFVTKPSVGNADFDNAAHSEFEGQYLPRENDDSDGDNTPEPTQPNANNADNLPAGPIRDAVLNVETPDQAKQREFIQSEFQPNEITNRAGAIYNPTDTAHWYQLLGDQKTGFTIFTLDANRKEVPVEHTPAHLQVAYGHNSLLNNLENANEKYLEPTWQIQTATRKAVDDEMLLRHASPSGSLMYHKADGLIKQLFLAAHRNGGMCVGVLATQATAESKILTRTFRVFTKPFHVDKKLRMEGIYLNDESDERKPDITFSNPAADLRNYRAKIVGGLMAGLFVAVSLVLVVELTTLIVHFTNRIDKDPGFWSTFAVVSRFFLVATSALVTIWYFPNFFAGWTGSMQDFITIIAGSLSAAVASDYILGSASSSVLTRLSKAAWTALVTAFLFRGLQQLLKPDETAAPGSSCGARIVLKMGDDRITGDLTEGQLRTLIENVSLAPGAG